MDRCRIAVISGGTGCEREVSLSTGRVVLAHLDRSRYRIKPVRIEADGRWTYSPGFPEPAEGPTATTDAGRALACLVDDRVEVVFLALHGTGGEDGSIQGFLDVAGLPYTGSDVYGSALAMDKIRTKEILDHRRIPTPAWTAVRPDEWLAGRRTILRRAARLGLPVVAKSPRLGSTVGIEVVRESARLGPAIDDLLALGPAVLLERYIDGMELTCGVLDGTPLPPTEIVPPGDGFFDYEAKYTPGATVEITPARLAPAKIEEVQKIALAVHVALGLAGYSRTDLRMSSDGRLYVLETNTLPGMTPTSLFPQAAAAAGIAFPALLDRLVEAAMRGRVREGMRAAS